MMFQETLLGFNKATSLVCTVDERIPNLEGLEINYGYLPTREESPCINTTSVKARIESR
jgi:hypothetical protein